MENLKIAVILGLILIFPSLGFAQATLGIGDHAPELKYSKWIKGTPVTEFKNDHLYAFEFWATWCGPCKAAMPHLSELARKYKSKATIVGVNIWEKTGDKPYESSLPAVTKFVNGVGDKMDYNVIADNNEQYMANKWMIAAGQNGIPATFLLKGNQIVWIGHPMTLDSIMESVLSGKYDVEATKKQFDVSRARNEEFMGKFRKLEPMQVAIRAKEYDKALAILDTLDVTDPLIAMQVNAAKTSVLFSQKKDNQALAFSRKWIESNKTVGGTIAGIILGIDGLSEQSYLYAAELGQGVLEQEGVVRPLVHHFIATAYSKAGNIKKAIEMEELAIQGAKDALKNGNFVGSVMDSTVKDFQASLAEYKKKL